MNGKELMNRETEKKDTCFTTIFRVPSKSGDRRSSVEKSPASSS